MPAWCNIIITSMARAASIARSALRRSAMPGDFLASADTLSCKLASETGSSPNASVPFQRVVTMFDRLAEAGTANVGLARGRGQTP